MEKLRVIVVLFLVTSLPLHAQLVINEIMQSNVDCIMDDLNEFPDSWVELYNEGTEEVSLAEYCLGISDDASVAWSLPERMVRGGEHVVVYCDKVGSNTATGIHTDFRLESGKGGAVYLFHHGEVVDELTGIKKQPAPNIAYGRREDGSNEWGYMETPTPGENNCGVTLKDVLPVPVFSLGGRVMAEGESVRLDVRVAHDCPSGAVVRYTIDGSEPTMASPLFTEPMTINSNTVVRAKTFCEGYLSQPSTAHSYLFFPTNRELTLPVVSLVTDSRYLYDDKIGIYVEGTYSAEKVNYKYDWRRPVNLEYFERKGRSSDLNQLCEARIAGGATRVWPRKTLAVYANKRFGEKRLRYEFFPDQRPGVTDFKSILLRNAGNDFHRLYMRDAIIQRTMTSHVDLDWQAWRPAIVYINGEYTGILNIRERANEDNIYTNYGGLEDIDLIENWYTVKKGTSENRMKFIRFYQGEGHTMAEYEQWMDCEEFANLMIMNIYFDNRDFPTNNIVMWRPRAEGGRWRWVAKDTDFGMGLNNRVPTYNTIAWINDYDYDTVSPRGNSASGTLLFRHLMEDGDFRRMFTERAAIYMGDFLNERGIHAVWDPMYETIKTEYPYHNALIANRNYDAEVGWTSDWISKRTDIFYQYLADYYGLGTPTPLTVNKELYEEERSQMEVWFNDIRLSEARFDGRFYVGSDVRLRLQTSDGMQDGRCWRITTRGLDGEVSTQDVEGSMCAFSMPECESVAVEIFDSTDVGDIRQSNSDESQPMDDGWYTTDGRRLRARPTLKGIYIHRGRKVYL